ncbi:MAG: GNAT family N-acetyltransferase [Cyclobacteriaceae bacterium]
MIETTRLCLREWRIEDLSSYAKLNADKQVMEFFPRVLTWEETEQSYMRIKSHFEQYGFGFWAAEERVSGRFIGFIGLQWTNFAADFTPCVEIGWRLAKKYWSKGYATEGASACLDRAFQELNLEEVYSFTAKVNIPSEGVMKKIGMEKIGEFDHPKVDGKSKLARHVLYMIKVDQWAGQQAG